MERNYYRVLGVPETASYEEIQEAFRRLARAYHPDVSGADTASRFREILEAWEVLGDVRQRRDYDERARRQRAPRLAKRAHAWPAGRRQPPAKPRTTA